MSEDSALQSIIDLKTEGSAAQPVAGQQKTFFHKLMDNPLFAAGAGVAGIGMGMAILKQTVLRTSVLAERMLTVSLEIPSKDRSYQWVLQWINLHTKSKSQHIGIETTFKVHENGSVSTNFDFIPSPGRHFINYKNNWIQVVREREKSMIDLNSGQPWETVILTTPGRSRQVFYDLLEEARKSALKKEEGKTVIYSSMGPEWRPFGRPRRRRPIHSVILAKQLSEKLLGDVREFARCQQWYTDRGVPYRRGYLLHGPPGCGKSSFIMALAGELEYNICILNLNERGLTDDKLNVLLSVAPPRSLILLEDVDAAFVQREAKEQSYSITFSGLLNCLDGVASTEERIVFMTTNHLDRLDPALIRPGRVDLIEEVGYADTDQVIQMFLRFFPEEKELADKFAQECQGLNLSMAALQGYFLMYKNDPHEAVDPKHLQRFFPARTQQQQQHHVQQQQHEKHLHEIRKL